MRSSRGSSPAATISSARPSPWPTPTSSPSRAGRITRSSTFPHSPTSSRSRIASPPARRCTPRSRPKGSRNKGPAMIAIPRFLQPTLLGAALALAACTGAPLAGRIAAVPRQFPLLDFFANPERAYLRLSDDGRTLGFMQPVAIDGAQRRMNVYVQALEGSTPVGEPRKLTSETARDISIYYWKGSDTILYEKDFGGDENFHVVAVDVKSGRITDLTPGEKVRASIQDDLPEDAGHILVSHNRRNPEVFDVYRYDLATGKDELVAQNPGDIVGWQTDHAGRLRMAVRSRGLDTITLYRADEKSEWKPIITTDYKTEVDPAWFSADNKRVYMISNRGRDKKAMVEVDPARPDVEQVLFVDPEGDAGAVEWSRARKRVTAGG